MKHKLTISVSTSNIFSKIMLFVVFLTFSNPSKSFAQAGAALNFDGIDDFVQVNDNSLLDFGSNDFTVEYWVYKKNANVYGGVSKWNTGLTPTSNEWGLLLNADGAGSNRPNFIVESGSTSYACPASTNLNLNTWYHLAGVREGTSLKIYINGLLENTISIGNISVNNVGRDLLIDRLLAGHFGGANYDEVRIWNTARTVSQININKNCELQGNESGLIAYYKFNQGTNNANNSAVTTLADATANNNTGNLNNFALNGTSSNWIAGGGVLTGNSCNTITNNVTTNGGSGLALAYPTLADAINSVNFTAITSPVIITLNGNETAPAGGYQITAQGSATNTITIQGNASTITASSSHTIGSRTDAIFKLIGADYITLQNFTMQENPANTVNPVASNSRTEFGIGLFYASTTNGSQNNIIQNNTISLNRLYPNSFGIYSTTRHTFTNGTTIADVIALSGSNSNNKFYGNIINNVNNGITLIGSATASYMDENNEIGGSTPVLGNTITNWGSNTVSDASLISNSPNIQGVFSNHQKGCTVANNSLISANGINTTAFRGIYHTYTITSPTGIFTNTITNNQISLNAVNATTFQHIAVTVGVLTATLNITNNTMFNSVVSGVGSSTTMVGVNYTSYGTTNVNNNIIKNWTSTATTGGFTGFTNTSGTFTTLNINNNKIGEGTSTAITFSAATSGTITGISNNSSSTSGTVSISNNDFRGIVQNNMGSGIHTYIQNSVAVANLNVSDNTFTNITANTMGTINFILHNYNIPANGTQTFNNNSIVTGFNKQGSTGSVILFNSSGASPNGTTTIYTNNNFSNITVSGNSTISGISNNNGIVTSSPNKIVTGNIFNNWTSGLGTITGISFNHFGATSTISNNTISNFSNLSSINGLLLGNGFGGGNPLEIKNNSITKLSSTGSGSVVAISTGNNSPSITISENTISEIKGAGTSIKGMAISGGLNSTINRNKITNLEGLDVNSVVIGMDLSTYANTSLNIKNNYIGNISNLIASNTGNAIIGINVGTAISNSTINLYHNTVYLNATSTGTNFGTSALFHNTNTTATFGALNIQNNIFINNSVANGTGTSVAYRRSTSSLANYMSTSNNNNFIAPFIFADGTNIETSIDAFKARVSPRENNSISETVNFLSTNPADATYLHINPTIPTAIESSALPIANVITDFDSDIRQGQIGYTGTGTAPDIGADEFDGIVCALKPSANTKIIYNLNATAVPLTASGSNLLWYTSETGGTGTTIAPTPSTSVVGTTSYWVSQNPFGCESNRLKIDVIVGEIASHLNFDGNNDYVEIVKNFTSNFTIEFWINTTQVGANGTQWYQGKSIVDNEVGGVTSDFGTSIINNKLAFGVGAPDVTIFSTSDINDGNWKHVAVSWEQTSGNMQLYINGVLESSAVGSTSPRVASNLIKIGTYFGLSNFFNGNLDELRIWNTVRTIDEINNNKNCELQGNESNLIAYYTFNQGFKAANNTGITTLIDKTSNGLNGTLYNFSLNGNLSNWLLGSPVINDVMKPIAPVANNQTFCNCTISNLIPAPSSSIKWYVAASGGMALQSTDLLTSGTYYVAAVNANGCESNRTPVLITLGGVITEWTGSSWTNGLPTAVNKAVISSNYSGAGFSACTLDVIGNAIVTIPSNETLVIDGMVNVAPTANLTFSNNANLVQNQNVTNIGNITSLRDSSPVIRLDYVAWSSPVLNQNLLSFSPATLTNRFYRYEPSGTTTATSWIAIDPISNSFLPAVGNLIRTSNTWSPTIYSAYSGNFTGIPNNGNYAPAVTLGYNLLGNPYPSPLSGNTFIGNNAAIGATTLYFWTHVIPASSGTYAQNNYASYTTAGGVAAAAGGAQPNGTIQVGQGFLTNVTTAGNAVFNNAQRVGLSTGEFFRTNQTVEKHRLWFDLTSPNNLHNQMMVAYMTGALNSVDASDGKLFGNTSSVIYNVLDNEKYVIQGKALPFTDSDSVPVGFIAANAGEFTIALSQFDGLFINQDIYLKDNFLNITHNLKNTAYSFTSNEGEFTDRFKIVYVPSILSNPTIEFNENSVIVYKNNTSLEINSGNSIIFEVNIFDMRGRKISSKSNINTTVTRFENLNIQQEVILVEVVSSNGNKVTKKIIF